MDRQSIRDELIEIMRSQQFSSFTDPSELNDDTSLLSELIVDSLQLLDFIVLMENKFGFKAKGSELTLDTFDRFGRVIEFVQSHLPETSGVAAEEVETYVRKTA